MRTTAISASTKAVVVPTEREANGSRAAPIKPPDQPINAQPVKATK